MVVGEQGSAGWVCGCPVFLVVRGRHGCAWPLPGLLVVGVDYGILEELQGTAVLFLRKQGRLQTSGLDFFFKKHFDLSVNTKVDLSAQVQ